MKIFFIGINGIGMSGLAQISKAYGYEVYGSDNAYTAMTQTLEDKGIKVYIGHDADRIDAMDVVVYSTAIKPSNVEYKAAVEQKKIMFRRGEYLAKLMEFQNGIAIAGTHGKTTTTSLTGMLFLPIDPTIYIGGILPEINSTVHIGKKDIFISEADESDNSFLYMRPKYSIITNLEADHMDFHHSFDNIVNSFQRFIENTTEEVVLCAECPNLRILSKKYPNKTKLYGFSEQCDIMAKNVRIVAGITYFDMEVKQGKTIEGIALKIPGNHNILNALASLYVGIQYGLDSEMMKHQLLKFTGAKRRFDILYNKEFAIIDDYAHHPTEIKATLDAAKLLQPKRIIAVFQPHRYSRTQFLFQEFKNLFNDANCCYLLPIYSAGETNSFNITESMLLTHVTSNNNCHLLAESAVNDLVPEKGDMIIFMGAGSVSQFAQKFAQQFQ